MTTHTITDLHAHLFETLAGLRAGTITTEQAATISQVAQAIINTAKVEVEYLRVTGKQHGSGFLPGPTIEESRELPGGVVRVVQHRIKG
jgi:hypothetical protein